MVLLTQKGNLVLEILQLTQLLLCALTHSFSLCELTNFEEIFAHKTQDFSYRFIPLLFE